MPNRAADLLRPGGVSYLTFYARTDRWQILEGIGETGKVVADRLQPPVLVDFAPLVSPWMWTCVTKGADSLTLIERIRVRTLHVEETHELDRPVQAIACAPDGRLAFLQYGTTEQTQLRIRSEAEWSVVETVMHPDLSSRLAWIDDSRIAFENVERRLSVIDLDSGRTTVGPPGTFPTAAAGADRWFAIADGEVIAFDLDDRDLERPTPVARLAARRPTSLRVTHDGEVFVWTEPRLVFGTRSMVQRPPGRSHRMRELEDGLTAVMGPYG